MSNKKIDLMNLPDDLIELKSLLFLTGINDRAKKSIDYIHNNYHQYERLKLAISFIEYHFTDAIKSEINQLTSVGFFPSTESQMELDYSIKHAIIGSYKASFSDLRRSLELTLTSIFLVSEHSDKDNAINWVLSQQNTPFFSTMIEKLIKTDRFKNINDNFNWKDVIKKFYWKISDFAHTKGQLKGYKELNNLNFFISGTSAPNIDNDTLKEFLDCYIETVEHIVTILSLYNPIILIGLPLDEKFGLNGPFSGFYHHSQAEQVNDLIPICFKEFFKNLKNNDEEIKDISEWIHNMPDLTDEDIKKQVTEHKRLMKKNSTPKIDNK